MRGVAKRRRASTVSGQARAGGRSTNPSARRPAQADARAGATRPAGRPARTWLLVGGGAAIAAVTIVAVLLGQGANQPTGPAALRSPTTRPSMSTTITTATPPPGGFSTIADVRCDPTEQITYHVHAHLEIRVDGAARTVPGTIGQRATCIYWLHTHATDGIVHIEAPAPRNFTLGQFFDVWGQPLDGSHVADATVPTGSRIWVFVNGSPFDGDPRTIPLADRELIELQIGPAAVAPLG